MTDSANQVSEAATPLKDAAVDLINSLQAAAPQVTEAVVKYTWAQGVAGLVGAVFVGLGALALVSLSRYFLKRGKEVTGHYNEHGWEIVGIFTGVIAGMVLMASVATAVESIPVMLAPEGAAVINIIEAARGAVEK